MLLEDPEFTGEYKRDCAKVIWNEAIKAAVEECETYGTCHTTDMSELVKQIHKLKKEQP